MKPNQYEIERWFDRVKGKDVTYGGRQIRITKIETKEKFVRVYMGDRYIPILNEDWEEFTKEAKIINQNEETMEVSVREKAASHEVIRASKMQNTVFGKSAEFLAQTMKNSIRKVSEDPGYIPQAQEIGSQVKNFIELAKTEVAYLNALNR